MLEKSKSFAKEFLEIIENQKRKLNEEYELDQQAWQQKYIKEYFLFVESMSKPNKPKDGKRFSTKENPKGYLTRIHQQIRWKVLVTIVVEQ